tara:strand:- start:341 stop:532 length:192 start_codon:yes stop_codon:yes gene_type:complete
VFLFWLPAQVIIHESCYKELELSDDLIERALIGALLNLVSENIVHFDDLLICKCQIILTPVTA